MATSYIDYTGDGANNKTFSFPSFQSSDVKVEVENVIKTATTHYNITNYTTSGGGTVVFTSGNIPTSGQSIRIYRDTDITTGSGEYEPKATFTAGSSVKAADLNNNQKQVLYAIWEEKEQTVTATDIKDGSITTAKLATDCIDGTRLADNAVNSEHYTDGSIDSAHYAAGSVNTTALADNSVTAAKIPDNSITSTQIAANAITFSELANDSVSTNHIVAGTIAASDLANAAVTTAKIADDAVDSQHYAADSIDTEHYAPNSVDSAALAADSVTGDQLADNAVDSEHYTDGSIDTDHIGAKQVTLAKVEDINSGQIIVGNSSGRPSMRAVTGDITISNVGVVTIEDDAVTTAKINADAIDSTLIADNAVGTEHIADAELTTLAGMQSGTASILAGSTALTATLSELNLLDGKSIVTTISSPTDVQIPTAQAVEERIVDLVTDLGGFVPIANETSFPTTNPDPGNNAGTIISVKALASNLTSNGSGVATIANGAGSGNTVTINGMANSDTIEAGKGILVETTSTLHTYTFHRETLAPADITSAASAVSDFNERYRVHAGEPTSSLNEGDLVYDTNADKMKVYDSTTSAWKEVTSTGDFKYLFLCPAGGTGAPTINGSIATYDLREGSNSGSAASVTNAAQLIVSVNGVVQKANTGTSAPAEGFALVDANTIIFSSNLPSGASVFIHQSGSAVSIPTPGDNTVSTAKIQNQAVTTGKIADQAVDLTKLPHGDGTSNGKFLRSNNGADPTWETVSTTPEGTAILSTGESGGTKFLREDGDGTSSWQSVPAAVTQENVEDWVGGMVTGNTETGITVTYDDSDGTLDFVVADQTPTTTRGDIIYRGASADERLAKGTAGQYLKQGANDPEWADVVGAVADGCIFENDQTISNNYTIASGKGAHSVGPITVNATVTVNGNWVVS